MYLTILTCMAEPSGVIPPNLFVDNQSETLRELISVRFESTIATAVSSQLKLIIHYSMQI